MINTSDLSALLEKLSKLDPKLCRTDKAGFGYLLAIASSKRWMVDEHAPFSRKVLDRSILQGVLQQAIAAHPNLRYRLQNSSDGVHASIRDVEDETIAFDAVDGDAAIALLKVYVQWLESIEVRGWLKPIDDF